MEAGAAGGPTMEARVCVFTFEVPDGTWGGFGGRVVTPPDMAAFSIGNVGRRHGEKRLVERRRKQARMLLEAARLEQAALV